MHRNRGGSRDGECATRNTTKTTRHVPAPEKAKLTSTASKSPPPHHHHPSSPPTNARSRRWHRQPVRLLPAASLALLSAYSAPGILHTVSNEGRAIPSTGKSSNSSSSSSTWGFCCCCGWSEGSALFWDWVVLDIVWRCVIRWRRGTAGNGSGEVSRVVWELYV